ncbi:hypothetical protein ACRAWG_37055 [Methylobacterium sp. P31]
MAEMLAHIVRNISRAAMTDNGQHAIVFAELNGRPSALAITAADALRLVMVLADAMSAGRPNRRIGPEPELPELWTHEDSFDFSDFRS